MTTPGKLTIATPSDAWNAVEKVRSIHRWLTEVSSVLRVTTDVELPREVGERTIGEIDPWDVRRRKAVLDPDFPLAIWSWVGRVVGDEYRLDLEGDEELKALYNDIDKAGSDLKVTLQVVFEDMLVQASPFVLVDDIPGGGSPFWVLFTADQARVAEWGKNAAGAKVPKRIHLWNPAKATLRTPARNRVRVLLGDGEPSYNPETKVAGPGAKLGERGARWEWWEEDEQKNWRPSTAPDEQPDRFAEDEIPGKLFQCGRRDRENREIVYPMSEWLGEACLHQFREYSDHCGFIGMLRSVSTFVRGLSEAEWTAAQGYMIAFKHRNIFFGGSNPSVDMENLETSGAAGELSFKAMEEVRNRVKIAKLTPIEPQKVQTLGEAQLGEHAALTPLSIAATLLRDGAEQLMKITAARLGKEKPGTLHIPTLFTLSDAEEQDLAMIRELQKEGRLSWQTSMEKLKLGNRMLEDVDLKEEEARLAKEQEKKDDAATRRVRSFAGGDSIGEGE